MDKVAFVERLAQQARRNQRMQRVDNIGQFLYGMLLCVLCMVLVGGALQAIGWLP